MAAVVVATVVGKVAKADKGVKRATKGAVVSGI